MRKTQKESMELLTNLLVNSKMKLVDQSLTFAKTPKKLTLVSII